MPAILILLSAAVAAGGDRAAPPPQARQVAVPHSPSKARDRATNQSLLAALRRKRDEVARTPEQTGLHAGQRRYALWFLDRQIEKLKRELRR